VTANKLVGLQRIKHEKGFSFWFSFERSHETKEMCEVEESDRACRVARTIDREVAEELSLHSVVKLEKQGIGEQETQRLGRCEPRNVYLGGRIQQISGVAGKFTHFCNLLAVPLCCSTLQEVGLYLPPFLSGILWIDR
jgi:hypothetical protein